MAIDVKKVTVGMEAGFTSLADMIIATVNDQTKVIIASAEQKMNTAADNTEKRLAPMITKLEAFEGRLGVINQPVLLRVAAMEKSIVSIEKSLGVISQSVAKIPQIEKRITQLENKVVTTFQSNSDQMRKNEAALNQKINTMQNIDLQKIQNSLDDIKLRMKGASVAFVTEHAQLTQPAK